MSTGVSSGSPYPTNIYILAKRLNSCEARNLRHFTYQRNVLAWLSQAFCWYNSLYLLVKVRKKIIANRCSLVNENYEWWAFISDTSNREFPPDFLNILSRNPRHTRSIILVRARTITITCQTTRSLRLIIFRRIRHSAYIQRIRIYALTPQETASSTGTAQYT